MKFRPCFQLFLISLLSCSLLTTACKEQNVQHGTGQRASLKEKEDQNRNLMEQVVSAAEEMERHPDPTYLRNAVGRLNTWLASRPETKGFVPDPELAELSSLFQQLGNELHETGLLLTKFAEPNSTLTEQDGESLLAHCEAVTQLSQGIEAKIPGEVFTTIRTLLAGLAQKLNEANEFQFANKVDTYRSAINQYQFPAWFSLTAAAKAADSFAKLLRTDQREFCPEDADYFKQTVWFRNIAAWAKGSKQDDLEKVKALFDWTVKSIVLSESGVPGPVSRIHQTPWQSILLSQASGMERALVFMELLRQDRLDSFIIRPAHDVPQDFPILVGVRIENNVYLFLPELGIALPGKSGLTLDNGLVWNSVATLAEVQADDSILRYLDLSETETLPLSADSLKEVVAFVPTSPFSHAERMSIVEKEFSGNIYTVLATAWDQQKKRVEALPGISAAVQLWDEYLPIFEQMLFETESQVLLQPYLYTMQEGGNLNPTVQRSSSQADMQDEDEARKSPLRTASNLNRPLWVGKILFFKGELTGENGAAFWLQQGRTSDRKLKESANDLNEKVNTVVSQIAQESAQNGKVLSRQELEQIAQQFVAMEQQNIIMKIYVKTAARFYLGLLSLEAGNLDTALTHLTDANLLSQMNGLWKDGSLYLIGRIHEAQDDFTHAASIYRAAQGPLNYGTRLRGKWLASLAAPAADATPEPAAEPEPDPVPDAETTPAPEADADSPRPDENTPTPENP
ncbi:MAG: procyclic acidic repetitive family protein [Planctomycetia bacterium]|nr:procyclic acidic repetitive family protein [Planctomycetia bacterium]